MPPTHAAKPLPQTPIMPSVQPAKKAPSFMSSISESIIPQASASEDNIDMDKYSAFIKDAKARGKSKEETKAKVDDLMAN